jgi:AcrR family transcriptional regulator
MLSNDNPSTRERSLRAALEVVRDDGLRELTTRSIARRSGLTQPAIYRHFSGVEELVRETLGRIRALVYETLEASGEGVGDPEERLARALNVLRDFAIEYPRLYDALFLQIGHGPLPPPLDRNRGGNIFGYLVERVTECVREGLLRDSGPVGTALSLAAHAQGLILLYRQGRFGSPERFAEAYARSMEDLLRGLRPPG